MGNSKLPNDKNNSNHEDTTQAKPDGLAANNQEVLQKILSVPNIWNQPPVSVRPEKFIGPWEIARIITPGANPEYFGYHFVGRDLMDYTGAVSSKIDKFDPKTMRGVTVSGRVYQLVGLPGRDPDADYVLAGWLQRNGVEADDGTAEFIEHYGISLEDIEKQSK